MKRKNPSFAVLFAAACLSVTVLSVLTLSMSSLTRVGKLHVMSVLIIKI
jgi:hypothetical protein